MELLSRWREDWRRMVWRKKREDNRKNTKQTRGKGGREGKGVGHKGQKEEVVNVCFQ